MVVVDPAFGTGCLSSTRLTAEYGVSHEVVGSIIKAPWRTQDVSGDGKATNHSAPAHSTCPPEACEGNHAPKPVVSAAHHRGAVICPSARGRGRHHLYRQPDLSPHEGRTRSTATRLFCPAGQFLP